MEKYTYKNSGIEWLGDIPSHWIYDKIFRLCNNVGSGGTPQSTNQNYYNGDIYWVQSGDLTDNYVYDTKKKINELAIQNSSAKIFPKNTLLVAMYGATIGKVGIMTFDGAINQACCALNFSPKIFPKYSYYLLLNARDYLLTKAYGGGQQNISQETLKQLHLFYPPLQEQKFIGDFLDKATARIDSIISIKQQQLAKLEDSVDSKIKELVALGLRGEKTKQTDIDWFLEIPESWRVIRLKTVLSKIGSGLTPKGGAASYVDEGVPIIRSQNVKKYGLDLTDVVFIKEETHEKMQNSKVSNNDVLLNITGASLGRVCLAEGIDEANVNQHVCIIRPFQFITPKFLYYLLYSEIGQAQVFSGFKGSGREGLNLEAIKSFRLPLPPSKSEQNEITDALDILFKRATKLSENINSQIKTLQNYRKSLIHECVTGKKQVTNKVE